MTYTEKKIKLITKVTTNSIYYTSDNDISTMFWYKIFNKEIFKNFITTKYIPYKVKTNTINDRIISDVKFCLSKLESVKDDIDLINKTTIEASDLFFSYVLFEKMISFFNDYYKDSYIKTSLLI
jgi:hypothetical protein